MVGDGNINLTLPARHYRKVFSTAAARYLGRYSRPVYDIQFNSSAQKFIILCLHNLLTCATSPNIISVLDVSFL